MRNVLTVPSLGTMPFKLSIPAEHLELYPDLRVEAKC